MPESSNAPAHYTDEGIFRGWVVGAGQTGGVGAQIALFAAVLGCWLLMTLASLWFSVPQIPGFDGSLLHQPSPMAAIVMVLIALPLATLVGTFIAGAVRFEAGIFAATLGLAAISVRGGTIQSVLQEAAGNPNVFYSLALELLILAAILAGIWWMLLMLGRKSVVGRPDHDEQLAFPATNAFGAAAVQVIASAICIMILCQSQAKYQTLASVGIASLVGTTIAHTMFPTRPSFWFWGGALLVGLIGYIAAAMSQDPNLAIGLPHGLLAPLARPLPLDYASAGPAGAILAYWRMKKK